MNRTPPQAAPEIEVNKSYDPFSSPRETPKRQNSLDFELPPMLQQVPMEVPDSKQTEIAIEAFGGSKFFQIGYKYLVSKVKSGLMLVNIYRAFERILYEQNVHALANEKNLSQKQMFPELVELNAVEYEQAIEMKDQLSLLGFDYESMGSHTISINGIPTISRAI